MCMCVQQCCAGAARPDLHVASVGGVAVEAFRRQQAPAHRLAHVRIVQIAQTRAQGQLLIRRLHLTPRHGAGQKSPKQSYTSARVTESGVVAPGCSRRLASCTLLFFAQSSAYGEHGRFVLVICCTLTQTTPFGQQASAQPNGHTVNAVAVHAVPYGASPQQMSHAFARLMGARTSGWSLWAISAGIHRFHRPAARALTLSSSTAGCIFHLIDHLKISMQLWVHHTT